MMDTARAQTTLHNLKTTARAKNQGGNWYANVVECDMTVSVRGVVESVNRQHSVDSNTRGVCWDE
jgi:hypothetical protein